LRVVLVLQSTRRTMRERDRRGASLAIALVLAAAACGRGGLADLEAQGSEGVGGAGGTGNGAGAGASGPGSGSGGAPNGSGSGAGSTGSMTGSTGSMTGSTGSMTGSTGSMTGSTGSMTGSTGTGGMICPSFGDPCTDCAANNCPDVWCGCVNNVECTDLFACFAPCMGNAACEQACLTAHSGGISAAVLVGGCAGTTCSGVCDWGNSGFTPCEECIYTDCAAEMNACLAAPACSALYACLGGCAPIDLSCQQQCYLDFAGGVQLLEDALQCIADQCQGSC
jgi:hypothetical protein